MSFLPITDCSAVILAGGNNSRYGGFHKAFLRIDNQFIIESHLQVLNKLFSEIIIIANDQHLFHQFGVKVYKDIYENRGPLAGIHSALYHSNKQAVMVFGCDMPNLSETLITDLYSCWSENEVDICVPKSDGHFEPLHAIYSKTNLEKLTAWLETTNENAIYKYILQQKILSVEKSINPSSFLNINSPEDLARM